MKRIYTLAIMFLGLTSCDAQKQIVSISNSSNIDRVDEIVEIEIDNPDDYTIFTADGVQMECQTTYDGKFIFAANVEALSKTNYELRKGKRLAIDTTTIGRIYPEWFDDFAWENDKIGFRTYSQKMQERGDKLFGYDIFTKRAKIPVLDILYGVQFDSEYQRLIKQLRVDAPKMAGSLSTATTYHVDHGIGMDYYVVGPTLGCGTSALVSDGEINYPGFYESCEILDQGGLRLTFRLTYAPVNIGGDMVTEVRTITLDSGVHFNHIEVEYQGLTQASAVAIGLVLHDRGEVSEIGESYMAYAEPTHTYGWQTYNAVIFPEQMKASIAFFDQPIGVAEGHLLTEGVYEPNSTLSYYMGAGWNRWGFAEPSDWFEHVKVQQQKYEKPLSYKLH